MTAQSTPALAAAEFFLAKWRGGKIHVSPDGVKTVCSHVIPAQATISRKTLAWYLHSNCYNCVHRLWDDDGPEGYLRPFSSRDFPLRKACDHGCDGRRCIKCDPSIAVNWPCRNGCTDPQDHDPRFSHPRCAVYPPKNEPAADGQRCVARCESKQDALCRANPGMFLDLADSAFMYCYHCDRPVNPDHPDF